MAQEFTTLGQEDFSTFTDGTSNSLTTKLEVESITKDFINEFEVEAVLRVPWSDVEAVSQAMLGGLTGVSHADGAGKVQLPVRFDEFKPTNASGETRIVAVGISAPGEIAPMADTSTDANKAIPKFARLTVEFRTAPWELFSDSDGDYVMTETLDMAGEFIPLSPDNLFWEIEQGTSELSIPLTQGPNRKIAMGTWTVTLHYVDLENFDSTDRLAPFIGTVNKDKLFSPRFNRIFERETLLFEPPTIEEITSPLGKHYDITLRLTWKPGGPVVVGGSSGLTAIGVQPEEAIPNGWNLFFRPGYIDPQPVYTSFGSSDNPFFRPYTPTSWRQILPEIA